MIDNNKFILKINNKLKTNNIFSHNIDIINPVNDEFFIIYEKSKKNIYFYNMETLERIKILKNIDCYKIKNFRNIYLVILNEKEIQLIYIKIKEIIQILDFEKPYFPSNCLFYSGTNDIYINLNDYINKFHYSNIDTNEFELTIKNVKREYEFTYL